MGRAYSASNLTMHLSSWSFMGYLRIQWNFRYENAIGTAVEVQNIIEVSNLGRLVHACTYQWKGFLVEKSGAKGSPCLQCSMQNM